MEKQTPRQNKNYSRIENSTERNRKGGVNTSKYSTTDKQSERNSSRKRERSDKYKQKGKSFTPLIPHNCTLLGPKRGSKTRYSSYRRQNSSNNIESKPKERGASAHQRPRSAKDPGQKESTSKYTGGFSFGANCDYKNPEEFHKLRYSLANNQENKTRRPSSARGKDDSS